MKYFYVIKLLNIPVKNSSYMWVIPRQIALPLEMTLSDFDETVASCLVS